QESSSVSSQFMTNMLNPTSDAGMESIFSTASTRTPEDSEDDGNGEEDQGLRIIHPDGQQESSSVSSQFVTIMLNPTSDVGMESIFTTASSSVALLPTPIPTMTPSIITTITTASHPPIPSTPIPSEVLQKSSYF
nr:hypothetical protein [Tanacetum cinerariifolium]